MGVAMLLRLCSSGGAAGAVRRERSDSPETPWMVGRAFLASSIPSRPSKWTFDDDMVQQYRMI